MALPFLKGKPKEPPVNRVKELTSKGFSEIEIIDVLRKEGYSPQEIDLALSQVLKESIEKSTSKESSKQEGQTDISKRLEEIAQTTQSQPQPYMQTNWEEYFTYVDYIIQSRVNEVVNEVKLMEEKYQNLQRRIEEIVSELKTQKGKEGEIKNEIYQNFYNLEKSIKDLSIKIEGMEEILKEILPTLIDSVRTLNSILNNLTKKS